MQTSTNPTGSASRTRTPTRRARIGMVVRRVVGGAILLSGTVIFAVEVSGAATPPPARPMAPAPHLS